MKVEISEDTVISLTPDQVSADLGGELAILHVNRGRYYGLNEVGSRIWEIIQTPTTVGAVIDQIVSEYEVDRETCRADLLALLADLENEQLVALA